MLARIVIIVVAAALFLAAGGCAPQPESTQTFVLPPGDVAAGEAAFLRMRCYDCHRIPGVELPVAEQADQALVTLGGKVSKVTTYGDLLNSIINPSHRLAPGYAETLVAVDGESKMTNYNRVMTIADLIDLVAYLQTKYEVRRPPPPSYPVYSY